MEDLFCSFEGSGGLGDLLILDEGKFGEHFYLLDDAIVSHELGHSRLVIVLRNASKP